MTSNRHSSSSFARIILNLIPRRITDFMSSTFFSLQIFVEDSILASSHMHYVVISFLYLLFLAFGIGLKNLLGFDAFYYFQWSERIVAGIYSVLHNEAYTPTSSRSRSSSPGTGHVTVELFFVIVSLVSLVAFFATGFRKYQLHAPGAQHAHAAHSHHRPSLGTEVSAKGKKQTSFLRKIASRLRAMRLYFTGQSTFSRATSDFTQPDTSSEVKELYIWSYHPFLKNSFVFFNPFQLLLLMVIKRSDSIALKLILLIIIVSITIIFYLLVHLFEQKSRGEKNLAAQVMQVQQDFYVRWHQARRIAEREVIQGLIDEGEIDPQLTNRLSDVSRTMQQNHDCNMHRRTQQDTTLDTAPSRTSTRSRRSAYSNASSRIDDDSDEENGLRVIPPHSASRNPILVSAPKSKTTSNPFQKKRR